MNIYKWYAVARWLYLHKVPLLPKIIKGLIRVLWTAVIPYQVDIGDWVSGSRCRNPQAYKDWLRVPHWAQDLTIDETFRQHKVPVIDNRVYVGVSATAIDPITIGNEATIGAGAAVVSDILDNYVVAEVPVKIVKTETQAYHGL